MAGLEGVVISNIRRLSGYSDRNPERTLEKDSYLLIPSPSDAHAESKEADLIDLGRLFLMLWRRKWLLAGAAVVGLAAGYGVSKMQTPLYQAENMIMLEPNQTGGDIPAIVIGNADLNDAAFLTELEVLRSNVLMQRVIDALDLAERPEFSSDLVALSGWQVMVDGIAAKLGFTPPFFTEDVAALPQDIVRALRSRVDVQRQDTSYVIDIRATSEDPVLAAAISDEVARQYIALRYERRQNSLEQITDWFDARIVDMRQRVEAAESRIESLRAENLAAEGTGLDAISGQLATWNVTLAETRAQLATQEARLEEFYNSRANGSLDATALVEGNATVATLRQRAADLAAEKTELVVTYGPRNERVLRIEEREAAVRRELNEVVERNLVSSRDEAALRADAAAAQVRALEQRAQELSETSLLLRQAEREASTLQQVYGNLLTQRNENDAQHPLPQADAREVAQAVTPRRPSSPNTKLIAAIGGVLGLGLGLGGVMLAEYMRQALRSKDDVESAIRLPMLATIPKGRWGQRVGVVNWMRGRDGQGFLEAIRQLRTALLFSSAQEPQVVMVTSARIGEGKSTVALALASLFAGIGKRVLLVDGDLRRPTLSEATKLRPRWGLGSVLAGDARPEQAVVHDPDLGFDILVHAHPGTVAPVDALSTPVFRDLVEALRVEYDVVIFDTAPVLYASDAIAIGKLSDSAIFVVREGVSLVHDVQEAVSSLLDVRIPVAGVALNMSKAQAYTGYYQNIRPVPKSVAKA